MKNNSLLDDIYRVFSGVKKPSIIYLQPAGQGEIVADKYLAIQRDFSNILENEMSDEQCSMMIGDSWLISDEALCYFLPRLAKTVLQKSGFEELLYCRLENLNQTFLSQEQKVVLNRFIITLKELEQKIEMDEKQEVELSWAEWEEARMQSEKINDKFLLAIARGNIDDVKKFINQGINVNERDNNGNSPLDIAKYKGHIKIVELLAQTGARE